MGGEVCLAGSCEGIDLAVCPDRLQARAIADRIMAIVDEQRRAALLDQPTGDFIDGCRSTGAGFNNRAERSIAARLGHGGVHRHMSCHRQETTILIVYHPLTPALFGQHHLAYRQGVEKLVGDQQHRT